MAPNSDFRPPSFSFPRPDPRSTPLRCAQGKPPPRLRPFVPSSRSLPRSVGVPASLFLPRSPIPIRPLRARRLCGENTPGMQIPCQTRNPAWTHQGCYIGGPVKRGFCEVIRGQNEVVSGPNPARNRSKMGCFSVFRPSDPPKTPLALSNRPPTSQKTPHFRGGPLKKFFGNSSGARECHLGDRPPPLPRRAHTARPVRLGRLRRPRSGCPPSPLRSLDHARDRPEALEGRQAQGEGGQIISCKSVKGDV